MRFARAVVHIRLCFPVLFWGTFLTGVLWNAEASKYHGGLAPRSIGVGRPTIKLSVYDEHGAKVKHIMNIYPDSDLVMSEVDANGKTRKSKIVLECTGLSKVRWEYTGDGAPVILSSLVGRINSPAVTNEHKASLAFPNGLSESDTGNYTCRFDDNQHVSSSVYLYVPGSRSLLFVSEGNDELQLTRRDTHIRFPCSTTHPNAQVSLYKIDEEGVHCPVNDSLTFDSKTGFHLNLLKFKDEPTGKYLCSAMFNKSFHAIEYRVVRLEEKSAIDFSPSWIVSCSSNLQCGPEKACIAQMCLSPCDIFPIGCPHGCKVVRHSPQCQFTVSLPVQNDIISNNNGLYAHVLISPVSSLNNPLFDPSLTPLGLRSACRPGLCGKNAECIVREYEPYCICDEGFTGNPRTQCYPMTPGMPRDDPCKWSPCGKNEECQEINGYAVCAVSVKIVQASECIQDADCDPSKYCKQGHCENSCDSTSQNVLCGNNAHCVAINHVANCQCNTGYTGNAYHVKGCKPVREQNRHQIRACSASSCGENALCRVVKRTQQCFCAPGFKGNAYVKCYLVNHFKVSTSRPEQGVGNIKLQETCSPNPCGTNAKCRIINGLPACKCWRNSTGDPYTHCELRPVHVDTNPDHSISCEHRSNCPIDKACYRGRCVDPCPGSCGSGSRCKVVNHSPVCSCPEGSTGDPFVSCRMKHPEKLLHSEELCIFCGPNSICNRDGSQVNCACDPRSEGKPPNCRRTECQEAKHCPNDRDCVQGKCQDPCPGYCSADALCAVEAHKPICKCPGGYYSDSCRRLSEPSLSYYNPCQRSPCGANTICTVVNAYRKLQSQCTCQPGYLGNPYSYYGCQIMIRK